MSQSPNRSTPIVNFTNIFSNRATIFHLKELFFSISQDDFSIVDLNFNTEQFRIERRLLSMIKQTKTLYDTNRNVIWVMEHPIFKLFHRTYKFKNANGDLLFKIRNRFRLIPGQGKKLTLKLNDRRTITSKGKWFDLNTPIVLDNTLLAEITKSFVSVRGLATGLSVYNLTVQPNVDIPMCFAFVIVLDEEREKKSSNRPMTMMRPGGYVGAPGYF
jgi:uncharacterized protein YxjI